MQKCKELSRLKKTSHLSSLLFRRQSPSPASAFLPQRKPEVVLDPEHPGAHDPRRFFPSSQVDAFGIAATPFGLLEPNATPPQPPFDIPIELWADRVTRSLADHTTSHDISLAPAHLPKFQKPGRLSMSLVIVVGKKATSKKKVIRLKIINKLKTALCLAVIRAAEVKDGKLVLDGDPPRQHLIHRGWTYTFYPSLEVFRMPYTELVPSVVQALTVIHQKIEGLEKVWARKSLNAFGKTQDKFSQSPFERRSRKIYYAELSKLAAISVDDSQSSYSQPNGSEVLESLATQPPSTPKSSHSREKTQMKQDSGELVARLQKTAVKSASQSPVATPPSPLPRFWAKSSEVAEEAGSWRSPPEDPRKTVDSLGDVTDERRLNLLPKPSSGRSWKTPNPQAPSRSVRDITNSDEGSVDELSALRARLRRTTPETSPLEIPVLSRPKLFSQTVLSSISQKTLEIPLTSGWIDGSPLPDSAESEAWLEPQLSQSDTEDSEDSPKQSLTSLASYPPKSSETKNLLRIPRTRESLLIRPASSMIEAWLKPQPSQSNTEDLEDSPRRSLTSLSSYPPKSSETKNLLRIPSTRESLLTRSASSMIYSSAPIIGKVPTFKQKAGFKRGILRRDQEKPEGAVENTLEMGDDDMVENGFQPRQKEFKLPTPKKRPTSKSNPWHRDEVH